MPFSADRLAVAPDENSRTRLKGAFLIATALLRPDPSQPRQQFPADKIEGMAASIKSRGFQQPLKVRPAAEGGYYYIIDGEMRFRSAQVLGLDRVPCWVFDEATEPRDIFLDQIVANEQRVNFLPYEAARAMARLRDEFSMSPAAIGEQTGFSAGKVSKLLALVDKVVPEIQQRLREIPDTSLTFRSLYALSQLPPVKQPGMAQMIERDHLTAAEAEAMVKREKSAAIKRRSGRPQNRFRYATPFGEVEIRLKETGGDLVQRQLQALAAARRQVTGGEE